MDNQNIHRQLKRQINKYLSVELIADNPALSKFIDVVNSTYLSYGIEDFPEFYTPVIHLKVNIELSQDHEW